MSLANTLLNGGYVGGLGSINPARYGHEQGASVIAMESVEELHEIFLESYNYEQAELAAATEGVALEGSQYEAVAEASVGNMFTKIKEFFVKLWNKVKAFFHEVRKYLDAIFMSGKDFCKKYEKEINKLDNLKDFSYKMYKYDDKAINEVEKIADVEAAAAEKTKDVEGYLSKAEKLEKDQKMGDDTDAMDELIKKLKKDSEDDAVAEFMTKKCKVYADLDEYFFGLFRNGAKDASDKDDIDLKSGDVQGFADALTKSAAKDIQTLQTKSDKVYKKAIDAVGKAETAYSKTMGKTGSKTAEYLRNYSSYISKCQNVANKKINAWKAVIKERDGVYKQVIMAAMSNNRKNSK